MLPETAAIWAVGIALIVGIITSIYYMTIKELQANLKEGLKYKYWWIFISSNEYRYLNMDLVELLLLYQDSQSISSGIGRTFT